MEFYETLAKKALLAESLDHETHQALARELAKEACCQALHEIREVLDDDTLDDPACFHRIEKIVTIYENLGSNGGSRHDFS